MARTTGSKNRPKDDVSYYASMSVEERIELIANLIIDRIEYDPYYCEMLIKKAEESEATYGVA